MIKYHEQSKTFHLYNDKISYIIKIMRNGQPGQLYFGKRVRDRESFDSLYVERSVVLAPCEFEGDLSFSAEVLKQEYPAYGKGDFRSPAYQLKLNNGSRITEFVYEKHEILNGKPHLDGLPQTHGEQVETLLITLYDKLIDCRIVLKYHLFDKLSLVVRGVEFANASQETVVINRCMSACLDLYDSRYEMVTLDGAWSRERHVHTRPLVSGVQAVSSARGASSAMHNPFLALKRPETTENIGEAYGFTLIYSGNFLAQAEVDAYDVTRVTIGINPFEFAWNLRSGEVFQTPEAVLVYSDEGLNGMSRNFHRLFRENLMRGRYKDKTRPVLLNNWEATYFDFDEESILKIAATGKELGVDLFVLDDGWFGKRDNDYTSLGDWSVYLKKLPEGIEGLSKKITAMGLSFGLWFEPEMTNEISELYSTHPDYVIKTPGRKMSYGRNQFVLDFSRDDVVEYVFDVMCKTLDTAEISYIKWDMNRNITEAYSLKLDTDAQEEFFHRYILGVYRLYEKLITRYPDILFESCASGGNRFDAGMLYYAPQAWCSDNTDAVERLHIQYGTSYVYPIVSIGSHVAAVPNHQVDRITNLKMRGDVAMFGTFGYELDFNKLSAAEKQEITQQIQFFNLHKETIQFGDFYRLHSGNIYSWMAVSQDKKKAVLGYYKILATPNPSLKKVNLVGLCADYEYTCNGINYFGDELMNIGFLPHTEYTGLLQSDNFNGRYHSGLDKGDFTSQVYVFEAVK